ncbi:hypothetical protein [Streptomyces evansiae]|uniref:hypothetical protein n=1 Tax=Streptomyces evansiae TaxID=3075535 RepID=UPI00288737AF|nr:hypothetical protein [Streptomyces sp. DSM 41859]MDT0424388.1 hypothetical protein [Streptomyces sp. DSM 41859]
MSTPPPDPLQRRPDWVPDTTSSESARRSWRLPPHTILATYAWRRHDRCLRCGEEARTVADLPPVPGPEGDVPLATCGSCFLAEEEARQAHAEARGRRFHPGKIGRRGE